MWPGSAVNASHTDGSRSAAAPSIWWAEVDTPQRKPGGNCGRGFVAMRAIILTDSKGSQRVGVNWELRLLGRLWGGAVRWGSRLRAGGGWARPRGGAAYVTAPRP